MSNSLLFFTDLSYQFPIGLKRINFLTVHRINFNLIRIKAFTNEIIQWYLHFAVICCFLAAKGVTEKFIQEKYGGCKLMMKSQWSKQYSLSLSINQYPRHV